MKSKKLSFDKVEIIELPIALGDNPSVSTGAPLTVEWKSQKRTTFSLDFFEKFRPERRSRKNLVISPENRKDILLNHGFCLEEILDASLEADRIKRDRRETKKQQRLVVVSSPTGQARDQKLTRLELRQHLFVRQLEQVIELKHSLFSIESEIPTD
jgi:poly-gamma-glutamate capsule biosynthesis protein CapA/YwtB (metallophosphatase superfamily)